MSTKHRFAGKHLHSNGVVIDPTTLAGVESLDNGQLAIVTDQPGRRLWVREGSTLYPLNDSRTTEDMVWVVDYATGVSPPDGTVITSQAEYDALGAPLKYVQDVERVRPTFIDHCIKASVLAGNQYAMADALAPGYPAMFSSQAGMAQSAQARNVNYSLPIQERAPGIFYQGARSDVYSGIAGTLANVSDDVIFTRSSGTWTPGELVGKFAEFTSGGASGRHAPIVSNDATTCTVQSPSSGLGATTLTVFELTTHLIPTVGPGGLAASFGVYFQGYSPTAINTRRFQYLDFQDNSSTLTHNFYDSAVLYDCIWRGTTTINEPAFVSYYYSMVQFNPSSGSQCFRVFTRKQYLALYYCWVRGRGSPTNALIYVFYGVVTVRATRLSPDAGLTDSVVYVEDQSRLIMPSSLTEAFKIDGVTTAAGISIVGWGSSTSMYRFRYTYINNCSVAVKVVQYVGSINGFLGTGNLRLFDISGGSSLRVEASTLLATYTTAKAAIDGQDYDAELTNRGDEVRGQYGSVLLLA